jgi:hypothetical protein
MARKRLPSVLPGGIKFTPKLKYKRDNHFLDFLKEYQELTLSKLKEKK